VTEQRGLTPLDGAHVLLTGGTGFLGQATLEKLLSAFPATRMSLLIRERRGVSPALRLEALMLKPAFASWREKLGDGEWQRAVSERISVIEGDLGEVSLPGDIDVVIHAASTVSFDRPIDEAFATNVSGVVKLYQALAESGADPHVVHVSTAYVAGMRKGVVPEAALDHTVDWRAELASASATRADVERDSRRPETLRRLSARARGEHGKAGPQSVAAATEQARQEWVARRLVDYGRLRAQSLGWPDVYTFTKALGERAAEELWASQGHRLSVVRPAIVESSLRHPYPGWIDGFKMAEPLIIAYGQGVLPEFPGLPDSVIDIIPVDLVVNAMLAVAAAPADPGSAAYFHVGSGTSNPLAFRALYEHIREYFRRHPLPASAGRGHVRVPSWRFPGGHQVEFMLRSGERATSAAERALLRMPRSQRTQEWMTTVHRQRANLDFLRRYSDLYMAYTQAQVIYDDSRTIALHRSLPEDRVAEHGFDPAAIDWQVYIQEIHAPAVTALVRAQNGGTRSPVLRAPTDLPERKDVAAVFDLEGTVVSSNLVEAYLWARLSAVPRSRWGGELAGLARSLPRYLRDERRDRGDFIRSFLRRYAGADETALAELADDVLGQALLQRALPEAVRQIRRHRAAGHRTILITGAIDVLVQPLSPLFDEIVASHMHVAGGVLTGHLQQNPLVDEARAAWLARHAVAEGLDLSGCYAYGDSYSDRPLLELVGNPVAVNPDPALYAHARRHRWPVENWGTHARTAAEVMIDTVVRSR
jgi:alcohol-forming fatty acyl-CoA reductase